MGEKKRRKRKIWLENMDKKRACMWKKESAKRRL